MSGVSETAMPAVGRLGHVSFGVGDLDRSISFYDAATEPLGWTRVWRTQRGAGYGPAGQGDRLGLFDRESDARPPGPGFHLAFDAPSRTAVVAFHRRALAAGGQDAGAPGLRPHYGPAYFAAFVVDPDGHKLEAVHQ